MLRRRTVAPAAVAALACLGCALAAGDQVREAQSRYLFTWVGDDDRADSDFLAVVDLARDGDRYGTIVATMPVLIGDYWVQANAADHRVFSLDIHDPNHVPAVSSVSFDKRQRPHWLATDGSRIVVVNEPAPTAERRMWMLSIDRATGHLALDRAFHDAGSDRPGMAFDRAAWPHGATGTGVPHGTVFAW